MSKLFIVAGADGFVGDGDMHISQAKGDASPVDSRVQLAKHGIALRRYPREARHHLIKQAFQQ